MGKDDDLAFQLPESSGNGSFSTTYKDEKVL